MHSSRISIIAATIILTVAGFAASADARQPKTQKDCAAKAEACERRCAKNKDTDSGNCTARTCTHQYNNCIASLPSGDGKRGQPTQPGGGVLAHPQAPKPKIGHGPFSPTSGGILDASPGLPGQGPAGTGVPRPPKSGGVIIN
jgi:hypothetical protein